MTGTPIPINSEIFPKKSEQDQNKMTNDRSAKSTNQIENFPKKSMFTISKMKRSQKFVSRLPNGICSRNHQNYRTDIKFKKP
jgi:hypothetical protein